MEEKCETLSIYVHCLFPFQIDVADSLYESFSTFFKKFRRFSGSNRRQTSHHFRHVWRRQERLHRQRWIVGVAQLSCRHCENQEALRRTCQRPHQFNVQVNCFLEFFHDLAPGVVYFDQRLGAAHFKCWSKYAFSTFFRQKAEKGIKSKNLTQNLEPEC